MVLNSLIFHFKQEIDPDDILKQDFAERAFVWRTPSRSIQRNLRIHKTRVSWQHERTLRVKSHGRLTVLRNDLEIPESVSTVTATVPDLLLPTDNAHMTTSDNNPEPTSQQQLSTANLRIVIIYAVVSFLWILLSDKAVSLLTSDPATISLISTIKGWFFVVITSLLLFGLIQRLINQLLGAMQRERDAQAETARTHQLLNAIVDSSKDAIFAKDLRGRYLLFNRETARLTGKKAALALHKDDKSLFPPEQAELIQEFDRQVIVENKTCTFEERLSTVDGERVFFATKGPLRDKDGQVIGIFGISRDITEQRAAETSLSYSMSLTSAALESTPDAILIVDGAGRIVRWNQRFIRLWDVPQHLLDAGTDAPILHFVTAKISNPLEFLARVSELYAHPDLVSSDTLHLVDGRIIERYSQPQKIGDEIVGRFWSFRDVTERKRADADLRIAATAFDSQEGIFITDTNRVILRVNRAFTESTGYTAKEVIGRPLNFLRSSRYTAGFYAQAWETVAQTGKWQGEVWDTHKDGREYPKWLIVSTVKDETGVATHFVGLQHDITERKQAEETIRHLAFYDQLTSLPNRTLFQDRLKQTMAASSRIGGYCALLLIDLDNFKTLNDTLGHDMGDLLLKKVAQRLTDNVRDEDTVARLGGDEFVVMLVNLSENQNEAATRAEQVGEKIRDALNQDYVLKDITYRISSSIGASQFIGQKIDDDALLKQADMAMYKAKDAGRNTLRFFDPDMELAVVKRATQESALRDAIEKNQFVLHYQAQVAGDRLIGAEALVRWQHPRRGLVPPAEFIPLAEDVGLILPLGQWVLETACRQLALWSKRPETARLVIAVNVSAHQFRQDDFVEQVITALDSTGANPERLKLELTESLLVANVDEVIEKMFALKAKGVSFSLDDFGTGYSSLSYLKRLPLDQLKIDQSFVRDVLSDPNDASIAKTIITLAESLGMGVIAEGVETEPQRDFLARSGCHFYQGYFFGRPQAIGDFERAALMP